jgi:alcohol dehydrogenase
MKVGISSPHLIPHTAIVDPRLTLRCPPGLTAHAAADALAHCVEAFTAISHPPSHTLAHDRVFVGKTALTDIHALAGIALIGRSLVRAVRQGDDLNARRDLMLASLHGGLALATAGTAAAHALQYPVGALTHTAHGLGVGLLLPYVMEFNRPAREPEFDLIARALVGNGGHDVAHRDPVGEVVDLLAAVGIPRDLRSIGVEEAQIPNIAAQALTASRLVHNNPRPLNAHALEKITRAAYLGDRDLLKTASPAPVA